MGEGISVGGGKTADSLVDNSVAGNSEENQRPKRVEGITNEVSYEFYHGEIKRTDHFQVTEALGDRKIKKIRLRQFHKIQVEANKTEQQTRSRETMGPIHKRRR